MSLLYKAVLRCCYAAEVRSSWNQDAHRKGKHALGLLGEVAFNV